MTMNKKMRLDLVLFDFIGDCYKSIRFAFHRIQSIKKWGCCEFPLMPTRDGTLYILANGPSLKTELDDILLERIKSEGRNAIVVNFFASYELFKLLQPKYYCLADPTFFQKKYWTESIKKLFQILNEEVDWDMTLFIRDEGDELVRNTIKNNNIKIVSIPSLLFEGFERKRYSSYKRGIAVPSFSNVTIMCAYVGLNMGYSKMRMYGVDHSFLQGTMVNDNNQVCQIDHHFYGDELVPVGNLGQSWTMARWIYDKYRTFKDHEDIRHYADYLGAEIINCTKNSWIDAYTRLSQIEQK